MALRLLLIIIFFRTINCFGQATEKDIVGHWSFSKLTVTKQGKTVDSLTVKIKSTYVFSKNGTYIKTGAVPSDTTMIDSGRWKLIEGGKKIQFFDNKTDIPGCIVPDYACKIFKNKNIRYMTLTLTDGHFAPNTIYYKKTK